MKPNRHLIIPVPPTPNHDRLQNIILGVVDLNHKKKIIALFDFPQRKHGITFVWKKKLTRAPSKLDHNVIKVCHLQGVI